MKLMTKLLKAGLTAAICACLWPFCGHGHKSERIMWPKIFVPLFIISSPTEMSVYMPLAVAQL